MSLVKGKNVSMDSVTVSAAKSLDNGAKLVYVNYNGGRFNIQSVLPMSAEMKQSRLKTRYFMDSSRINPASGAPSPPTPKPIMKLNP